MTHYNCVLKGLGSLSKVHNRSEDCKLSTVQFQEILRQKQQRLSEPRDMNTGKQPHNDKFDLESEI